MSWMRPLGSTGIDASALGLGTVKFGRNEQLKYPTTFELPDDRSAANLLATAKDLGINLLDTAPAYGSSEERLGKLLAGQRHDWVLCTKVGEQFEHGTSRFDFSPVATRESVHRSLRRLATDVLDVVLLHSDGNDIEILQDSGALDTLAELKQQGLLRAFGISTKTVAGGLAAAPLCDVVMLTYNLQQREEETVLNACAERGTAALIKKPLGSGHLVQGSELALHDNLQLCLSHPGTSSAVVGTLSLRHLADNIATAKMLVG